MSAARERLIVLTTPSDAVGYRLAGVAVLDAADAGAATGILTHLLDSSEEHGIIAIHRPYLEAAGPALRARTDAGTTPLVVELPSAAEGDAGDRRARLRALLARAVGYEITFEPGGSG